MVSSISTFRGKQRLFVLGTLLFVWILYVYKLSRFHINKIGIDETKMMRYHNYINLNEKDNSQHILILTYLQNDEKYINNYFELLDKSNYANHLISIGLIIFNSTDNTLEAVYKQVNRLQNRWRNKFYSIEVYQKDFDMIVHEQVEIKKRYMFAKVKNYILSLTLREYHSWVVWIDVKLYSYPKNIFNDFSSMNLDVVVPNCLKKSDNNLRLGYDINNWQESDQSLIYQQTIPPNQLLLRDEIERNLLVNMSTQEKVPLDGIGTTFTMVKATVHREGAIFPSFIYQHELDTEGFAKIVKSMGFSVYGIPTYTIYHF